MRSSVVGMLHVSQRSGTGALYHTYIVLLGWGTCIIEGFFLVGRGVAAATPSKRGYAAKRTGKDFLHSFCSENLIATINGGVKKRRRVLCLPGQGSAFQNKPAACSTQLSPAPQLRDMFEACCATCILSGTFGVLTFHLAYGAFQLVAYMPGSRLPQPSFID